MPLMVPIPEVPQAVQDIASPAQPPSGGLQQVCTPGRRSQSRRARPRADDASGRLHSPERALVRRAGLSVAQEPSELKTQPPSSWERDEAGAEAARAPRPAHGHASPASWAPSTEVRRCGRVAAPPLRPATPHQSHRGGAALGDTVSAGPRSRSARRGGSADEVTAGRRPSAPSSRKRAGDRCRRRARRGEARRRTPRRAPWSANRARRRAPAEPRGRPAQRSSPRPHRSQRLRPALQSPIAERGSRRRRAARASVLVPDEVGPSRRSME